LIRDGASRSKRGVKRRRILALLCWTVVLCARANDWPNWRGPTHNGISTEAGWNAEWPGEGPKKLWRVSVGLGFSSIAVSQGQVFTMGNKTNSDLVFCLDADTGKLLWRHSYPCPIAAHYYEGGPSATPTVNGGRVYTVSKSGDLYCFAAAEGNVLWSKNLAREIGAPAPTWGFASSPLVAGDILVLNMGAAGVAVDKNSGNVVWKSAPTVGGYSTPVPALFDRQASVVLMLKDAAACLNAGDGTELWRFPWKVSYDVNAADPIVVGQRVFVTSTYKSGSTLVQIKGGVPSVLWETEEFANHINSSVLVDGFLYGVSGPTSDATLKCVDFKTGAVKWTYGELGGGSFMVADGKFIALSDKGELMIAPVSPDGFQPISRAQVLGGKCWTVPVLANGRIYCRNAAGDLVCLDVRGS
jgi:outer membrane protein assembly factor BamB